MSYFHTRLYNTIILVFVFVDTNQVLWVTCASRADFVMKSVQFNALNMIKHELLS